MDDNLTYTNLLENSDSMNQMLDYSLRRSNEIFINELKDLNLSKYRYSANTAVEALGLDIELINELIEDYISQIIKSNIIFLQHIEELKDAKKSNKELNFTSIRDFAHKNLGVARNLRIEDSEKLLHKIMTHDDLDYIERCLEGLMASVIALNPEQAYKAINLIKIKESI